MTKKELVSYMKSNGCKIEVLRITEFYNQEIHTTSHYNPDEIDKLIEYSSPFFNKIDKEFGIFTNINPIAEENEVIDTIEITLLTQPFDTQPFGNGCVSNIDDLIMNYIDKCNVDEVSYPDVKLEYVIFIGVHEFVEFNTGLHVNRDNKGEWNFSINDDLEIPTNTKIALEIAFQQWKGKEVSKIIINSNTKLISALERIGLGSVDIDLIKN